jgi:hypothetical protein
VGWDTRMRGVFARLRKGGFGSPRLLSPVGRVPVGKRLACAETVRVKRCAKP